MPQYWCPLLRYCWMSSYWESNYWVWCYGRWCYSSRYKRHYLLKFRPIKRSKYVLYIIKKIKRSIAKKVGPLIQQGDYASQGWLFFDMLIYWNANLWNSNLWNYKLILTYISLSKYPLAQWVQYLTFTFKYGNDRFSLTKTCRYHHTPSFTHRQIS